MSGEVPVPEGDEAKSLTPEELGKGQEDHCWLNHGSPYTTSVFPKDTERDFWFLDQDIWREEHKSKDDFEKTVEGCEDPECRDHTVILYKGISNQRIAWSGRRRSGECISGDNHLEWPPRIMGLIHSRNVCQKEVISFNKQFKEDPSSDEEYEGLNSWRTSYPPYHLDKKRCYYE